MHTEGPWKYEKSTKTIRSAKKNYWISTMNSWDGAVDNDANARLIAAAPSLLQALSEVVAEWDERNRRYCAEHGPGYYPPEDTGGIMLARAAIAKAEGK